MFRLIDAVERRPQAAFAAFLVLHAVVWTALPAILYLNLPLDLIEALTYGREWQLGYDKLPPLPWWLVEIVYRVFGVDTAYYALAQAVVVIAFILVWTTARPLVGAVGALVAILIIDGMHYFNFTAAKFNHDVIQLPFWALAGFAFHAGLRRGGIGYWVLLGAALGCALWAKYFVAVLVAPLVLFMLLDREARRRLAAPGPWVAAAVALLIMAPHLVWLVQNDFLPFHYAEARALPVRGPFDHLLRPVQFLGGQLFFLIPALVIAAPLFWPRSGNKNTPSATADAFDKRIITLLAFGPALAVFALSLVTGRGTVTMWGYPLWLFLGLWIVLFARAALDHARLVWIGVLWATVFAILTVAFIADYTVLPRIDHRYRSAFYPGGALAAAVTQRFEAAASRPPAYIIASMWNGGNVAHYSGLHPQPRVLIDGLPRRAPWIDLADLRTRGAVVVWTDGDLNSLPESFAAAAAGAEIGAPFALPFRSGEHVLRVGWAVLRPQAR
jgi:4-amino-4-deoxy-L-arabinose transferase-like glycosyltransferase